MTRSKDMPRRQWMFDMLAGAGAALAMAGCGGQTEDPATFSPKVDTSQAATSSEAPPATDDADKDAMKGGAKK